MAIDFLKMDKKEKKYTHNYYLVALDLLWLMLFSTIKCT